MHVGMYIYNKYCSALRILTQLKNLYFCNQRFKGSLISFKLNFYTVKVGQC